MKTVLVLIGPTGVGKTELSLLIANRYKSPILSADSRQLYRDLKIGTAAPTPQQEAAAKHYFVGTLGLQEYYSAAQYETDALQLIEQLHATHPVLLLTGGSMMYVDALCKGIDAIPTISPEVRQEVYAQYEAEGLEVMCEELHRLDPIYHSEVDLKNYKRVLHAIEICRMAGVPYSSLRKKEEKVRPFQIIKIGLNRSREELFERINQRVVAMVEEGLEEECRKVLPFRNENSLNTVGYKEMFYYLDGEWTLEQAVEKIQRNSRVYAKKQLTWFKRDESIAWFHPSQVEEILAHIDAQLAQQ